MSCAQGHELKDGKCIRKSEVDKVPVCRDDFTFRDGQCKKKEWVDPILYCDKKDGWTLQGDMCTKTDRRPATVDKHLDWVGCDAQRVEKCPEGYVETADKKCTKTELVCKVPGQVEQQEDCTDITCETGYELRGKWCVKKIQPTPQPVQVPCKLECTEADSFYSFKLQKCVKLVDANLEKCFPEFKNGRKQCPADCFQRDGNESSAERSRRLQAQDAAAMTNGGAGSYRRDSGEKSHHSKSGGGGGDLDCGFRYVCPGQCNESVNESFFDENSGFMAAQSMRNSRRQKMCFEVVGNPECPNECRPQRTINTARRPDGMRPGPFDPENCYKTETRLACPPKDSQSIMQVTDADMDEGMRREYNTANANYRREQESPSFNGHHHYPPHCGFEKKTPSYSCKNVQGCQLVQGSTPPRCEKTVSVPGYVCPVKEGYECVSQGGNNSIKRALQQQPEAQLYTSNRYNNNNQCQDKGFCVCTLKEPIAKTLQCPDRSSERGGCVANTMTQLTAQCVKKTFSETVTCPNGYEKKEGQYGKVWCEKFFEIPAKVKCPNDSQEEKDDRRGGRSQSRGRDGRGGNYGGQYGGNYGGDNFYGRPEKKCFKWISKDAKWVCPKDCNDKDNVWRQGGKCWKVDVDRTQKRCPQDYQQKDGQCVKFDRYDPKYSCPNGEQLINKNQCQKCWNQK